MPVQRDLARFDLAPAQQTLRGGLPARQLAQPVRADRPVFNVHERQQREFRDLRLAAISRGIEFAAARAPGVGQQEFALVPQVNLRRQHRAEDFSRRRHVIAANPAPQLDELWRQRRNRIEDFDDFLDVLDALRVRAAAGSFHDHPGHGAIAERNQDAGSCNDQTGKTIGNRIGKQRTQRDRQRDFAVGGRHVRDVV